METFLIWTIYYKLPFKTFFNIWLPIHFSTGHMGFFEVVYYGFVLIQLRLSFYGFFWLRLTFSKVTCIVWLPDVLYFLLTTVWLYFQSYHTTPLHTMSLNYFTDILHILYFFRHVRHIYLYNFPLHFSDISFPTCQFLTLIWLSEDVLTL